MQPQTARDFLALELATDFATDQGRAMPDAAVWACTHWPDFLHLADTPEAGARYGRQVEDDLADFEAYWGYAVALVGRPCPDRGTDAEKIAWLEQLDAAEQTLREAWQKG